MLELRLAHHIVAKVARQVGLGPQVDRPPAQQVREFRLHASERDIPWCLTGFELHGTFSLFGYQDALAIHNTTAWAWLILYAWLRLEVGLPPCVAYEEAVARATGARRTIDVSDLLPSEPNA